jgi:hypothetical protein
MHGKRLRGRSMTVAEFLEHAAPASAEEAQLATTEESLEQGADASTLAKRIMCSTPYGGEVRAKPAAFSCTHTLPGVQQEHDAIKQRQEEEVQAFMKTICARLAEQHEERHADCDGTILHQVIAMRAVLEIRRLETEATTTSPTGDTPVPSSTCPGGCFRTLCSTYTLWLVFLFGGLGKGSSNVPSTVCTCKARADKQAAVQRPWYYALNALAHLERINAFRMAWILLAALQVLCAYLAALASCLKVRLVSTQMR